MKNAPSLIKHALTFALAISCYATALELCAYAENSNKTLQSAKDESDVNASPKKAWGDFPIVEENVGYPWWKHVLLWLPNRVMDFVDIFRVDVGVGPSLGVVVRGTKYVQAGYRSMSPVSIRIGDFGREAPFKMEEHSEYGLSPFFTPSKDRKVCVGEFGVGADLFIVGAYGGICVEKLADFVAGIFFIDLEDDDIK